MVETTDVESTVSVSQEFVDSDIVSSLCVGSPIMESTQGIPACIVSSLCANLLI